MQPNPGNNISSGSRLASHFAVERKKAILAACLIGVMGFMWIRLLTGKGEPASAAAATQVIATQPGETKPSDILVTYTEPPMVAGRNDMLSGDFFSPGDWQAFLTKRSDSLTEAAASGQHQTRDEDVKSKKIRQIAEGLKLQIMEMGSEPQAFISDRLVKEGGKLTIVAGDAEYEFKVLRITRTTVELQCESTTFEMRIKEQ
jgi:hypothetical protein